MNTLLHDDMTMARASRAVAECERSRDSPEKSTDAKRFLLKIRCPEVVVCRRSHEPMTLEKVGMRLSLGMRVEDFMSSKVVSSCQLRIRSRLYMSWSNLNRVDTHGRYGRFVDTQRIRTVTWREMMRQKSSHQSLEASWAFHWRQEILEQREAKGSAEEILYIRWFSFDVWCLWCHFWISHISSYFLT